MKSLPLFDPIKKSRNFSALWAGQSLSRLGDSILFVVLPMTVYTITGSTMVMGTVMTLETIPLVILLPFAGLLVDRVSRVRLMIFTDIIRFILLLSLILVNIFHKLNMPILYCFAVIYGTMSAFFQPAYAAVRAEVFLPEIRNAANSLNQVSEQASRLIGPSLGGLILSITSITIAFGFDAFTFLISIVSLLFLRIGAQKITNKEIHGVRFFIKEIMGGYFELRKHTWLWVTIIAFSFINIAAGGIIGVLIPWLAKIQLSLPAYQYGILMSTTGLGSLVMGIIFGNKPSWRHRGILAYLGIGIQGVALLGLAIIRWFPGLVAMMFMSGAGMMLFSVIWEISLQELVPAEAYGRVASLDMLGSWALLPVGYLLTGWLAQQIGGISTIMIEASIMVLITISMLFIPAIRKFD